MLLRASLRSSLYGFIASTCRRLVLLARTRGKSRLYPRRKRLLLPAARLSFLHTCTRNCQSYKESLRAWILFFIFAASYAYVWNDSVYD